MRLSVMSCCVAFAAGAITYAAACGGRIEEPYCVAGQHLCVQTVTCCPDVSACGTGDNGCPRGTCCPLATEPAAHASTSSASDPAPPAPGTTGGTQPPTPPRQQ